MILSDFVCPEFVTGFFVGASAAVVFLIFGFAFASGDE
jgi:hypothetical protein